MRILEIATQILSRALSSRASVAWTLPQLPRIFKPPRYLHDIIRSAPPWQLHPWCYAFITHTFWEWGERDMGGCAGSVELRLCSLSFTGFSSLRLSNQP